MIKRFREKKGSALIITLLIMGILMTLALGLSDLVIREVRITTDIVNAGKAFYAAEAGIESALLDIHQNLSGFEKDGSMINGVLIVDGDEYDINEQLNYNYKINNKTKAIPNVDTQIIDKEIALGNPKRYMFNVLDLNESVTIPLFIQNENGSIEDIKNLRVEYFVDAEIAPQWKLGVTNRVIDMLRWKITGINNYTQHQSQCSRYLDPFPNKLTTESIGDYLPALEGTNYNNPSCFGTTTANTNVTDDQSGIEYKYQCDFLWDLAREAFIFSRNQSGDFETSKLTETGNPAYIHDFLNCHDTNYLTLTNIFNPEVLMGLSDFEKRNNAKIYYRIIFPDDYGPREYAKVVSTGTQNSSRKQIEAFIKPDSFLPVFNFSLYRTQVGGDNDKQNPQGYLEVPSE